MHTATQAILIAVDGTAWLQRACAYQGKCVRWLREERETLTMQQRGVADRVREQTGCLQFFTAKIGA